MDPGAASPRPSNRFDLRAAEDRPRGSSPRFLFFTNECVGLGHLRRCLRLARGLTEANPQSSALIVTGSPVATSYSLPPRVDLVKLPALARDEEGNHRAESLALDVDVVSRVRSRVAMTVAAEFDPTVAVVDKAPLGLRGELVPVLELLNRRSCHLVLGLRDVEDDAENLRRTWTQAGVREALERWYDLVLVYGPRSSADALDTLGWRNLGMPVHHVGYVGPRLADAGPRDLAPEYLLATAGGGVDGYPLLSRFVEALRLRPLPLPAVVVTGPLMAASELARLRARAADVDVRVEQFREDMDEVIAGATAVVSMAGYNTVSELLMAGKPGTDRPRPAPDPRADDEGGEARRERGRAGARPEDARPEEHAGGPRSTAVRAAAAGRARSLPGCRAGDRDRQRARLGRCRRAGRLAGRAGVARGMTPIDAIDRDVLGADSRHWRRSLALLRPFFARNWAALAGASGATVLATAATLAQPWPLALVIDQLIGVHDGAFELSGADVTFLALVSGLVLAIALLMAASEYFTDLWLTRAGERIVHDLRVALYVHLQRLSLAFHNRQQKGDLVTRVTGDVNAVGTLFSESLGEMVAAVLLLVGMAVVTFVLDPLLALATFAVVPLLFAVTLYYGRRVKSLARRQRKQEGQIASLAAETLAAMQVVKAFGSEDYESDRVATRSAERQDLGIEAAKAEARFSGLIEIIGAVARALVLVLGVLRVAAGAISPGDLIVFVTYANKTYRPLRDIARQATKSSRALARADRVADVLAADHVLEERSGSFAGRARRR